MISSCRSPGKKKEGKNEEKKENIISPSFSIGSKTSTCRSPGKRQKEKTKKRIHDQQLHGSTSIGSMYLCMYVYMYAYVYLYMNLCVYVCIYVFTCI
jgi:hypothetical protein